MGKYYVCKEDCAFPDSIWGNRPSIILHKEDRLHFIIDETTKVLGKLSSLDDGRRICEISCNNEHFNQILKMYDGEIKKTTKTIPYIPKVTSVKNSKMFMHTLKAIDHGCPKNRVFLVTNKDSENYYQAWKCDIDKEGLKHPGFPNKIIPISDIKKGIGRENSYSNGAEATAAFKKDSFYKEISITELEMLCKLSK